MADKSATGSNGTAHDQTFMATRLFGSAVARSEHAGQESRQGKKMKAVGLEPTTIRLKVECSTD